jgi:acetolactate synthase I/III small subunit
MTSQEAGRPARAAQAGRAGQSSTPDGAGQAHTLVMLVDNRHGALDRIVGLLRRRRARPQKIAIGQSETPDVVRISVVMDDSEVEVEHLIEQIRKIVDVRHIVDLTSEQTITRELALVKVNNSASRSGHYGEIIELGHLFGAHVVDMTPETITLEVTGSDAKIEKFVSELQQFGVREVARTGSVAMIRGEGEKWPEAEGRPQGSLPRSPPHPPLQR